ncbi:hypothetical protein AKJ16_DCAP24350 [Drosera capensis]
MVDKSGISEDFWTTKAYDILVGTPSQKSMCWMSASNQNSLCNRGSGNANNEFVNHGLLQWNQSRGRWTDCARHQSQCRRHEGLIRKWYAFLLMFGSRKDYMTKSLALSAHILVS